MLLEVEKFLNKYNIKNKKAIVGFSAGPDSVTLAFILSKLAKKYDLELILAYFNHNWRPDEAKIEQRFSENFAKEINAEFYCETAPLDTPKNEEAARDLRYQFFENTMKKYDSDVVFLAHNKNDNIETLIYRLIKGTGVKGLCSIPQKRENYYRPLLNITKDKIFDFIKENNLNYKFDSSNDDIKYQRNFIRKEILPIFKKINSNYLNNIENLIINAQMAREIIDSEIKKINQEIVENNEINREKYLLKTKALRYEFLNNFLGDKLKYRNYKNIKKIDDFIMNNKTSQISLNRELFLKIRKNKIFYVKHNNYDK